MDEVVQFKTGGDIRLTLKLSEGLIPVLSDFIRITACKSGFAEQQALSIGQRITKKISATLLADAAHNSRQVLLSLRHEPGLVTIKTEIRDLNFSEEEEFRPV
ncbi:MAG: hypothetical protein AB1898_26745 [Acidobacteriota bacterium]